MTATIAVRNASLLLPLVTLGVAVWLVRPDRRERGAALLAFVAAAVGIAALHAAAGPLRWWSFADVSASLLSLPADLWLGWAILWGSLPVLIRVPVPVALLGAAWLDLLALPRLNPVVQLGPSWVVGEVLGLLLVALPATLLGRWTARNRYLPGRATLQAVLFAALLLWLLPAVAIELGDGSWERLTSLSPWQLSLVIQSAVLVGLPGVAAVREFVARGGGTPYPWDPPARLVTSGPYAYVANPMQISAIGLLVLAALATGSFSVLAAAAIGVAFAGSVAGPHERDQLARRHGSAWLAYRRHVRAWWPRWRPYLPAPATLYLAESCDLCSATAAAVQRLDPVSMRVAAAESYPAALARARYTAPDGHEADGVAAVARGLEHVNLAWATVGWTLRAPALDRFIQVIVDGVGGGPRVLATPRPGGDGTDDRDPGEADRGRVGGGTQPWHRRRLGAHGGRRRGREPGPGLLPLRQRR